jgi:hypothetical protein
MTPFYSTNEVKKSVENRIHHNNSICPLGREIDVPDRMPGDGGYPLCVRCDGLNKTGK